MLTKPSTERALQQVLRRALDDLIKKHPNVHAHLHAHGDWELLRGAIDPLLRRSGVIDIDRLMVQVRNGREVVPQDLKEGMEFLIQAVRSRLAEHPGLADIEGLRLADHVQKQLDVLTQELIGPKVPDAVVEACRDPAASLVEGFLRYTSISTAALPPLINTADKSAVALPDIAQTLGQGLAIVIEGDPGIGKTSLLWNLARELPKLDDQAATIYVSLPEWAVGDGDLFTFIMARRGFSPPLNSHHLRLLAIHGRLTLLLDGWNELSGARLDKAATELGILHREYPLLGLLVATRSVAHAPPLDRGLTLEAKHLSDQQRATLVRERLPEDADAFLDHLYQTPALDDITRIPLYLVVALDLAASGIPADSRESLIARAVDKVDRSHGHDLRALEDHHRLFLQSLAVRMFEAGIHLPREMAKETIWSELQPLQEQQGGCRQLGSYDVLELLIGHHLVVAADGNVRFQHQLFQEWFASLHVERLARQASNLRPIINSVHWEEAVGFAVERLAKSDPRAAAELISQALEVEPVFAASLVRRGGDATWEHVGNRFQEFARTWHHPGSLDRAVTFMIATGRPEFADIISPFFASTDQGIQLEALRRVSPLPSTCLGAGWREWYATLPKEVRNTLANATRFDPPTFAVDMASAETDPEIVTEIVENLDFWGAGRQVRAILDVANDAVWDVIVRRNLENCDEPRYLDRRHTYLLQRQMTETDPIRRFNVLRRLEKFGGDEMTAWLAASISDDTLPFNSQEAWELLSRATAQDPVGVGNRWILRASRGEDIWLPSGDLPLTPDAAHQALLAAWLLEHAADGDIGEHHGIRLLDAEALKPLCEAYLHGTFEGRKLWSARPEALTEAVTACSPNNAEGAADLLSLLAAHGRIEREDERLSLPADLSKALRTRIHAWLDLPGDLEATRSLRAEAALVLGRIGAVEDIGLIARFLFDELDATGDIQARFLEWHRSGQKGPDPRVIRYLQHYHEAAAALHCREMADVMISALPYRVFAADAARVLLSFHNQEELAEGRRPPYRDNGIPDFALAAERQIARQPVPHRPAAHRYAAAILDQANQWRHDTSDRRNADLASELAAIAAGLSFGDRYTDILDGLRLTAGNGYSTPYGYTRLILAGERPPVEPIIAGYDAVLATPDHEQKTWQAHEWLKVMAFSDHPSEAFNRIQADRQDYRLSRILDFLAHVPGPEATHFLINLAITTPSIAGNDAWQHAMGGRRGEDVGLAMLGALSNPDMCSRIEPRAIHNPYINAIAVHALAHSSVRALLLTQLKTPPSSHARPRLAAIVESICEQAKDDGVLLAALDLLPDQRGRATWGALEKAIEYRSVWREPIGENSYRLVPSAAPELRARLLDMVHNDAARAQCATYFLTRIDKWRDEYGTPNDEPRHPNLDSGLTWPRVQEGAEM